MYPPLFYYLWADAKYVPAAAEGYTLESPPVTVEPTPAPLPEGVVNILTVKLQPGMKWSDGSALTAKDLVGTYNIYWAQNNSVWSYLQDVVAVDDTTVEFWIKAASPRALRLILRANQPAPYSVYGKWMDQAAALRATASLSANLPGPLPANGRIDRTKPNRGAQWAPRLIGFAAHPDVVWTHALPCSLHSTQLTSSVGLPCDHAASRRVRKAAKLPPDLPLRVQSTT